MANGENEDRVFLNRVLDASVRLAIIAGLLFWCLRIIAPFIQPVLWAIVISVAIHPMFVRIERALGGRKVLAATMITLLALGLILTPTVLLTGSLMETASELSGDLEGGRFSVPVPSEQVRDWPIIGDRLYDAWRRANANFASVLTQFAPQLQAFASWIVTTAAATGMSILKFILSLLIAGALLANAQTGRQVADAIARRLAGNRGRELNDLCIATVQSVSRGIVGVALTQSLLTGIGCMAVGLPGAGFWAVLVLLVATIQLPVLLVGLPLSVWVFNVESMPIAVAFAVWMTLVGLSDNVLKPLLLGRGVDVPMLVIFLGSIGGFVVDGIIGLVVGAVVLALGYTLFSAWLEEATVTSGEEEHAEITPGVGPDQAQQTTT